MKSKAIICMTLALIMAMSLTTTVFASNSGGLVEIAPLSFQSGHGFSTRGTMGSTRVDYSFSFTHGSGSATTRAAASGANVRTDIELRWTNAGIGQVTSRTGAASVSYSRSNAHTGRSTHSITNSAAWGIFSRQIILP